MAESMFFAHQIQLSAEAILVIENPDFRRMNYRFHPCSVHEKSDGKQQYHHIISDLNFISQYDSPFFLWTMSRAKPLIVLGPRGGGQA